MRFESLLGRDSEPIGPKTPVPGGWTDGAPGLQAFMDRYAGCTFGSGLYRVHLPSELMAWTERAVEMFPEFAGRVLCFASDWLGRQFAIGKLRTAGDECLTLMFEPGTGIAFEIPATFARLHEAELVEHAGSALAMARFRE